MVQQDWHNIKESVQSLWAEHPNLYKHQATNYVLWLCSIYIYACIDIFCYCQLPCLSITKSCTLKGNWLSQKLFSVCSICLYPSQGNPRTLSILQPLYFQNEVFSHECSRRTKSICLPSHYVNKAEAVEWCQQHSSIFLAPLDCLEIWACA